MKIYRINEVIEMTGLAKATIYKQMSKGEFPKPVKLTDKAIGWRQDDLKGWMDGLQEGAV